MTARKNGQNKVKPVPEGFHTVTPGVVASPAAAAIDFYKKAFGAQELSRMPGPDGKRIMHAEIKIGDSVLFVHDEWPGSGCMAPASLKGTTMSLFLYVEDVDAAFQKAVAAGATAVMPPADMFWGDRFGKVSDPFGHQWGLATHIEDVPPEEMGRRAQEWMANMAAQQA
jgi:PhnB protein